MVARKAPTERPQPLAVFDLRLTAALIRLGRDVASGRLDPRAVDGRWKSQRRRPQSCRHAGRRREDVSQWLPSIQPPHPEYVAMMGALAALQGVEAKGGWPTLRTAGLAPGASHPGVVVLRKRLAASGDLGAASVKRQPVRPTAGHRRARLPGTSRPARDRTARCPNGRRPQRAACDAPRSGRTQPRTLAVAARRPRRAPLPRQRPVLSPRGVRAGKGRLRHPRGRRQAGQRDADLQRAHDARRHEPVLEHPAEDRHRRDAAGRVGRPRVPRAAEHRGGARI